MLTNLLLPWLSGFRLDTILATDHHLGLELTALDAAASCPLCGQSSRAIHRRYDRTVAALPWANTPVRRSIHGRKFFCRNPACPRVGFTARVPALLAPSARRTQRLGGEQRQLALAQGGAAGARSATRQGMPVSPRTLLRLARRTLVRTPPTPQILGVDDCAFRKGQPEGTLLIEVARHQPIDMRADRSADPRADWRTRHPGVAIITRDRAPDYADGAPRGAPDAIQVADRLHLLQTARELLQRLLERQQARRHLAATAVATARDPAPSAPPPPAEPLAAAVPALPRLAAGERAPQAAPGGATPPTARAPARRTQRRARYDAVGALPAPGRRIRAIAQQRHSGRPTVRRFTVADHLPARATRRPAPRTLDPCVPYLRQPLAAGATNGRPRWRDLRDQHGYTGSRAWVARWVAQQRHLSPARVPAADQPNRRGRPPTPQADARPMQWLKADPDPMRLETATEEVAKLQLLRAIQLPPDLFAGIPPRVLRDYKQRVAAQDPHELRRQADALGMTLLAAFCWLRSREVTDTLVDLLMDMIHQVGFKAEQRATKELVDEITRVANKMGILRRMAETALDHLDGIIKEVLFPVVDQPTLQKLVVDLRTTSLARRQRTQTVMRRSYGSYYRRMVPPVLEVLAFRSSNTVHRPLIQALELIKWMTNLLDMVNEADARLHFTDVFKSLTGREHLDRETIQKRLLLCLYGLGTNTGLKRMAVGNDDVTYKDLLYIRRRFISCDHLRNAITQIVNAILSARQEDIWGEATTTCASDSKKFSAWAQNLVTEWHARYHGPGIVIYWHVEKKATCIYSQLKTCSSSEVAAMITGVIHHCSQMEIDKQFVDLPFLGGL
jgi:Tn3 transposase DDE domain/Transposase